MSGQIRGQSPVAEGFQFCDKGRPAGGIVPCPVNQNKHRVFQGSVLTVVAVVHLKGRLLGARPTHDLGRYAYYRGVGFHII